MPNRVSYTFVVSDKFSRAARSIAKNTRGIRIQMTKLGRTAKKVGAGVLGAFRLMQKGAIGLQSSMAPLLAGLAGVAGVLKGFTVGADFQDALADLSSITGAAGEDLDFLRQQALDMGKAAKVGGSEVLEGFKLVASAKPELLADKEALAQVTEQVLLLKNASGIELASAAEVTAQSLNQMGAGAEEAARFVNVLAAGSKLGASEVGDTGTAIVNSGVVAKRAGLSFEELNATIQVLAQAGIKGGRAGNQLKGVLLSLESSANKKLRPSVVGVNAALANLKALNLDNVQLTKLFGRENIAAGGALSDNASAVAKLSRELTGTNIAQEQANVRLGTMNAKMRGLAVTIANKAIAVFDRLLPRFEEIAEQVGAFLDSLTAEDIDSFADGLKNVLDIMVALAEATGAVASLLGPVIKAGANLLGGAAAGISDIGTLISEGELTAANSASFKRAVRQEQSRTDVNVNLNDPSGAVDSVESTTTGTVSGLNVGVNMATQE